jgi:hypothetical protein
MSDFWSALHQRHFSPSIQSGALAPHSTTLAWLAEGRVKVAKFWSALRQQRFASSCQSGALAPHAKFIAPQLLTLQLLLCCYDKLNDPERCRTLF